MTDSSDSTAPQRLSPDLAALHRDLDSLKIEERPSFGPELRAELEDAWARERSDRRPRRSPAPALVAATLGGILLLGLSVPQARAAVADVLGAVRSGLTELLGAPVEGPAPPQTSSGAVDPEGGGASAPPPGFEATFPEPSETAPDETAAAATAAVVFPDLLDRHQASRLVERFYPPELRGSGIGGTVGLRMYVDEGGRVTEVRLTRTSGVSALDSAALRAAPTLRFQPARNGGAAVGAWVELGIEFSPRNGGGDSGDGSSPGTSGTLEEPR